MCAGCARAWVQVCVGWIIVLEKFEVATQSACEIDVYLTQLVWQVLGVQVTMYMGRISWPAQDPGQQQLEQALVRGPLLGLLIIPAVVVDCTRVSRCGVP